MITAKQIRDAAKDSFINPKEPGPLATIIKLNDPQYAENRAIECIMESREVNADRDNLISKAIALLLIAKVQRNG